MKKKYKKYKKLNKFLSKKCKCNKKYDKLRNIIEEKVVDYFNDYYKKDKLAVVRDNKGRIVGYFFGKEVLKHMPVDVQLTAYMMLDYIVENRINY